MSKIDKIKEQIGWYKLIFGVATAIDISLIGWLSQNYEDNSKIIQIMFSIIGIFITTLVIVLVNKKALKKIDELEDL